MIKNIVFDIGNVLVNFGWREFIKKFGFSQEINDRIVNATVKSGAWNEYDRGILSDEEIVQGFINNDPGIEKELRTMCESFDGLLVQFEYAKGWIKYLQSKGFKVYALSNMSYKACRECADALNFLPMLDGFILSCDIKMIKPDPGIYEEFYKRFGLIPSECVFFDDVSANIEGAEKTGMHGIVFKDVAQATRDLEALLKKENTEIKFESKYSKPQRVGALICVVLIAALVISSLVFAILPFEWTKKAVKITLGSALVLPILTWIYIWMIGKLTHKETIADFHFFEKR